MAAIEMLWRQLRREVTSCELFETIDGLVDACLRFFDRLNERPSRALSIIGADSALSP